jgi:hypothetical protein
MSIDTNAEALERVTERIGEAVADVPDWGWRGSLECALVVHLALLLRTALQVCRLLWDCRNHAPRVLGDGLLLNSFHVQGSALWFSDGKRFALWDLESEAAAPVLGAPVFLPAAVREAAGVAARAQKERATVH